MKEHTHVFADHPASLDKTPVAAVFFKRAEVEQNKGVYRKDTQNACHDRHVLAEHAKSPFFGKVHKIDIIKHGRLKNAVDEQQIQNEIDKQNTRHTGQTVSLFDKNFGFKPVDAKNHHRHQKVQKRNKSRRFFQKI